MEAIYKHEIPWIRSLQDYPIFNSFSDFWVKTTKFGDPGWTFTIYFPLLYPLLPNVMPKVLIAGALSEFLNGVCKWLLHGERPFWYSPEHQLTPLQQFPHTCETGPGSPSGHVMVTSTIFYLIIKSTTTTTLSEQQRVSSSGGRRILWVLYGIGVLMIALSRVYIAAHFFHQILFGFIVGLTVGVISDKWNVGSWKPWYPLILAGLLALSGIFVYQSMEAVFGVHPDWSIIKAKRYCSNKSWVHVTTTPLAALVRDQGVLFGAAFSLWYNLLLPHPSNTDNNDGAAAVEWCLTGRMACLFCSLVNLGVIQFTNGHLPTTALPISQFYVVYFVYNFALVVFCFVSLKIVVLNNGFLTGGDGLSAPSCKNKRQ